MSKFKNSRKTFEDYLVGRDSTLKTQKSLFRQHIEPYVKNVYEDLAPDMVKIWTDYELKKGTIKNLLSLLKKYVRWKYKVELDCSRANFIIRAMEEQVKVKAWDNDTAKIALDKAKGNYNLDFYHMLLFALHTGTRKGEMLSLKWEDVDFLTSTVSIQQTKTGVPRAIPISDKLEEVLMQRYTVGEEGFVFPRCDPNELLTEFIQKAGIAPRITWHGLRHTYATLALRSGKSIRIVSAILGHEKTSTTINVYWQYHNEKLELDFLP
jgi:integrase